MRRFPWSWRSQRTVFCCVRSLLAAAAVSVGLPAADCDAQLTETQRQSLAGRIDAARSHLDPARIPEFSAATQQLEQAYANLVDHLEATADDATQQGWLDYLRYEPLAEAIANEAPVARQGRLAQELYWRLVRNQPGLEREPLVAFRRAVDQFISAARFRDAERTVQTVASQLGQVSELLRNTEGALTAQETARINRVLQYLEASRLAPELVSALQSALGQSNARILVGSDLVTRLINRPVDRSTPSDECILGVRVIGQARLNGMVLADLLPSEGAARIQLTLAAQFTNLGTGYASPVRLRTFGFGNVTASRVLQIGDAGVAPEPVVANAALDSRILGIEHHLRIVRRIAARRAAEQKPEANRVAAAKLETRVAREFAQETDQQLAGGNLLPRGEFEDVLRRLGLSAPERHWGSSRDYLRVGLRVRDQNQTTTAVAPPAPQPGHDLVVQLEESLVNNLATQLLADRTLTESELQSFVKGLLPNVQTQGSAPAQPLREAAAVARNAAETLGIIDPVKISFAALRPVIFDARDGTLRLGIRGTRFEQGDQVLDQALEITASYRPVRGSDGTVSLQRQGQVDVDFPGGANRRLSIAQIALRQAVVQKLAQSFPEQLLTQPLQLPPIDNEGDQPGGAGGRLQDVTLRAQQISIANGWVSVGFNASGSQPQEGRMLVLD